MAEGDETNNEAVDTGAGGGAGGTVTSGSEIMGDDPAGVGESAGAGVGVTSNEGRAGEGSRPGDWNPGEQSGGGGELY